MEKEESKEESLLMKGVELFLSPPLSFRIKILWRAFRACEFWNLETFRVARDRRRAIKHLLKLLLFPFVFPFDYEFWWACIFFRDYLIRREVKTFPP